MLLMITILSQTQPISSLVLDLFLLISQYRLHFCQSNLQGPLFFIQAEIFSLIFFSLTPKGFFDLQLKYPYLKTFSFCFISNNAFKLFISDFASFIFFNFFSTLQSVFCFVKLHIWQHQPAISRWRYQVLCCIHLFSF